MKTMGLLAEPAGCITHRLRLLTPRAQPGLRYRGRLRALKRSNTFVSSKRLRFGRSSTGAAAPQRVRRLSRWALTSYHKPLYLFPPEMCSKCASPRNARDYPLPAGSLMTCLQMHKLSLRFSCSYNCQKSVYKMKIISSKYSAQAVGFLDVEAPWGSIFFRQQGSTRNIFKKVILNIFKRKIKAS